MASRSVLGSVSRSAGLAFLCASGVACSAAWLEAESLQDPAAGPSAVRPAAPRTMDELRRALGRPISFRFDETPLTEAAREIAERSGVNVIVDPRAIEQGEPLVTLRVDEMSLEKALSWLTEMTNTGYVVKDEAVLVNADSGSRVSATLETRSYDVRGLTRPLRHLAAPALDLSGVQAGPVVNGAGEAAHLKPATLVQYVKQGVRPSEWSPKLGTSIQVRDGSIVVTQKPEVHELVARFLKGLRAEQTLQVRVNATLVAVPPSLLSDQKGRSREDRGSIRLSRRELGAISDAIASGRARVVDQVSLTCLNGQRNYALTGRAIGNSARTAAGSAAGEGVAFRGTIVEAAPVLSFDRRHVLVDVYLSRYAENGNGGGVDVLRFNSTVACPSGGTVVIAGAALPGTDVDGPRRLVALVTPTVLRLAPGAEEEKQEEDANPEPTAQAAAE